MLWDTTYFCEMGLYNVISMWKENQHHQFEVICPVVPAYWHNGCESMHRSHGIWLSIVMGRWSHGHITELIEEMAEDNAISDCDGR